MGIVINKLKTIFILIMSLITLILIFIPLLRIECLVKNCNMYDTVTYYYILELSILVSNLE